MPVKSSIYLITTPNGNTYVGSTSLEIKQRWHCHRSTARSGKVLNLYKTMREEGINNCKFEVLEDGYWKQSELKAKENEYMRKLKPNLNMSKSSNAKASFHVPDTKEERIEHIKNILRNK